QAFKLSFIPAVMVLFTYEALDNLSRHSVSDSLLGFFIWQVVLHGVIAAGVLYGAAERLRGASDRERELPPPAPRQETLPAPPAPRPEPTIHPVLWKEIHVGHGTVGGVRGPEISGGSVGCVLALLAFLLFLALMAMVNEDDEQKAAHARLLASMVLP